MSLSVEFLATALAFAEPSDSANLLVLLSYRLWGYYTLFLRLFKLELACCKLTRRDSNCLSRLTGDWEASFWYLAVFYFNSSTTYGAPSAGFTEELIEALWLWFFAIALPPCMLLNERSLCILLNLVGYLSLESFLDPGVLLTAFTSCIQWPIVSC